MPDLQQFSVVRGTNKSLTVPTWSIEFQVCNSETGAVISDHTGANAIAFPQVLGQMSDEAQDELVRRLVMHLLELRGIL